MSSMLNRIIVSSCGTSLLTGTASAPDHRSEILSSAASLEADIAPATRRVLDVVAETAARRLEHAQDETSIRQSCAELNGLYEFLPLGGASSSRVPDHHVLITSDTFQGRIVADSISAKLRLLGLSVDVPAFIDLAPRNRSAFQAAVGDLARWCDDVLRPHREAGGRVIFNLTGGYKAIVGSLQALGMLFADELVWIFEGSTELLHIPRLPVRLDTDEIVARHLHSFRRLALGEALTLTEIGDIPETLLLCIDGRSVLSMWGEMAWRSARGRLLGQRLLEPLRGGVQLSDRMRRSVSSLQPDRLATLNQRLDELLRCLETGTNLQHLRLKALQGNPRPPSTHEFAVWSDRADRCYGHFRDASRQQFIVDDLARHL